MSEAPAHRHLRVVEALAPAREDLIESVFGPEGYLSRRFSGYQMRKGQVDLARAVAAAIDDRSHLFAEGPTGTGKSLAYCAPAAFEAFDSATDEGNIVIATANIALQEQLVEKDLPLLQEILPWPFTFALLKGIGNYLCLDKMFESDAQRGRMFESYSDESDYERVREWADNTETGDKSELPFDPGATWSKFSTSRDECKGDKCDQADECFARRAQAHARSAQIIVTNYHMLFAHFKVLHETGGVVGVLPPGTTTVIMDEAHKAADIAREFFGFEIRASQIRRLARKTGDNGRALEDASNEFFTQLEFLRNDPKRYKTRLKTKGAVPYENIHAELLKAKKWFNDAAGQYGEPEKKTKASKAQRDLELSATRASKIATSIQDAMTLNFDPKVVYHLEYDGRSGTNLKAKLVDVSEVLSEWLFGHHSVICTSATLAGAGGKFDFVMRELGAPPEKTATLLAESPFDFRSQALLIVPSDVPQPQKYPDEYREAVVRLTAKAIGLSKGRTLCLFTSYRNLRAARDFLSSRCPYTLLVQGDAPRTRLIEQFKEDVSSVLLGTESFWAGVDVPGEALSCVVIDRIPFPTPDDPVLDAISDHNDKWFFEYSVPRAQIQLKQGVGRLIRTVSDRGVVVMLDPRLVEKSYGRQFIRALPPFLKTRDINAIEEFLR